MMMCVSEREREYTLPSSVGTIKDSGVLSGKGGVRLLGDSVKRERAASQVYTGSTHASVL